MSWSAKWTWQTATPGSEPAGARISAGKSGSVARSLPISAVSLVNRSPVSCIPSPESPANRMITRSSCSTGLELTGLGYASSLAEKGTRARGSPSSRTVCGALRLPHNRDPVRLARHEQLLGIDLAEPAEEVALGLRVGRAVDRRALERSSAGRAGSELLEAP